MNYHFQIHKGKDGFWAECCELSGCNAEADSMAELRKECKDALNFYLEEPADSKIIFPLPEMKLDSNKKLLSIAVEPEIGLAVLLRFYRSNSNMTQKQVSEKLGMKNVYSYQRLEKKSNPTLNIMKKIHTVFPEIKFEYLFQ